MKIQSALMFSVIGIAAYVLISGVHSVWPNFQFQSIPLLQTAMYVAVAAGLYLNVSDIDFQELLKNKRAITAVICFGIPAKIFLPGSVLLMLMPALGKASVFLCATVIAQIDPILAAKSIAHERFSAKTATILRCWSSFDDPITVLFAFYIFLPLFVQDQSNFIGRYFSELGVELTACALFALVLASQRRLLVLAYPRAQRGVVVATCVASGLASWFLLPASLGLMANPFSAQSKERVLNWIFRFSVFTVGALSATISLNWWAGITLGAATFFIAQPLVSLLFIRDSKANLFRLMFMHQNGMTAILLTIALELRLGSPQLLAITLPAIIVIAILYPLTNYLIEKRLLISIDQPKLD